MTWQPIETAPLDRPVWIWNQHQPEIARYACRRRVYGRDSWVSKRGVVLTWLPTHWADFPPPPDITTMETEP